MNQQKNKGTIVRDPVSFWAEERTLLRQGFVPSAARAEPEFTAVTFRLGEDKRVLVYSH